ncbi:MAG: adhesin, partial [Flavobacteriia bacterium]|nr:adhesin [Flavobacteriia bacterium]
TANVTGLAAGIYTVTVTDANGCTATASQSVGSLSLINVTATVTSPILCNGQTATVNVTATGGTGPYNGTGSFANVAAGNVTYTVTDANGCSGSTNLTVTEPAAITSSFSNTNVLCNGASTGAIDLTIGGGIAPYSQTWSNNAITEDISGLSAGTFSVTINDANGCSSVFNTTLSEPTAIQLSTSVTDVSCFGNATGSIDLNVIGGVGPYTYSWDNGSSNQDISNLIAGSYTVTVTDNNNCSSQTTAIVNQPAAGLSVSNTTTNVLCNGAASGSIDITLTGGTGPFTFLWNDNSTQEDISNLVAGNYNVIVTDNNNCSNQFNFSVTQPTSITVTSVNNDILCNGSATGGIDLNVTGGTGGYSFNWSNNATTEDITGIPFGSYSVNILDNNGCAVIYNTSINQPPQITLTKSSIDVDCFGASTGSINITVNGGVPGYSYSWNNGANTEDLSNIVAGTYTLIVTDANGCNASTSATVNEPAALTLTTSSTPASCNPDGSVSVSVSGGTGSYTYAWAPGGANTATVTGVAAGNYFVTVTDANGC